MVSGTGFLGTMTLLLVTLATNNASATMTSENDDLARKTTVGELIDVLRLLTDNDNRDRIDDENDETTLLGPKIRKSGTSRPKYDPGLKWMGLGKRGPDPVSSSSSRAPIGTELFTDMRRFFDVAHKGLVRNRSMNDENDVDQEVDRGDEISEREAAYLKHHRDESPSLKFDSRSKNVAQNNNLRKNYYNPSLLWTGLGR